MHRKKKLGSCNGTCTGIVNGSSGYKFVIPVGGYAGGGAYAVDSCSSCTGIEYPSTLDPGASVAVLIPPDNSTNCSGDCWLNITYDVSSTTTGAYACTINVQFQDIKSGPVILGGSSCASLGTKNSSGYYPIYINTASGAKVGKETYF